MFILDSLILFYLPKVAEYSLHPNLNRLDKELKGLWEEYSALRPFSSFLILSYLEGNIFYSLSKKYLNLFLPISFDDYYSFLLCAFNYFRKSLDSIFLYLNKNYPIEYCYQMRYFLQFYPIIKRQLSLTAQLSLWIVKSQLSHHHKGSFYFLIYF